MLFSHPSVIPSGLGLLCYRHYKPVVVVVLVLAEPQDFAVLVEVWDGGALTAWPCPAGAAGFPSSLLGSRRSCRLAPQHRARPLPLLQVHMHRYHVCIVCLQVWY